MKWLFALLLALIIFGGAALVSWKLIFKPQIQVQKEQRGEVPLPPVRDVALPEFQAAAKLRQEGKLTDARAALSTFLQKYPDGLHTDEAKDLLGEVNMQILMSPEPAPEKQEYIVKPGDVLQRVAARTKSTPELIMRTNNMTGTMLRIGQKLQISHPDFSLLMQRNAKTLTLLDRAAFFKRYRILNINIPGKAQPKITTKVAEIFAWYDGKRIGIGSREYPISTRWIRLATPHYMIYAEADTAFPVLGAPAPATGLSMAAGDLAELSALVNRTTPVTITD